MKLSKSMLVGSLLLGGILSVSLYSIGSSLAAGGSAYSQRDAYSGKYRNDDHSSDDQSSDDHNSQARVEPPPLYQEECGSCHTAYPPKLLPTESWQQIMLNLEKHYGENAELDEDSAQDLAYFLVKSSRPLGQSKWFTRAPKQVPMRITELPYFIREHDEIPSRFVSENDNVGSFSQCNACHKYAEQGDFDEDNIVIPGIGRWDD